MRIRLPSSMRLLQIASVLALLALGLIAWSLFDPGVVSVMVAMSVAQAVGTLSFLGFLIVVGRDVRHAWHHDPESTAEVHAGGEVRLVGKKRKGAGEGESEDGGEEEKGGGA